MNVPLILSLAALVATILSLVWIRSELRCHQRQIDTLHDVALARPDRTPLSPELQEKIRNAGPGELIEVEDVVDMEQVARFLAEAREEEERLGRTLLHSLGWSSGSSNPYADLNRIHWQRSEELEAKVKSREES